MVIALMQAESKVARDRGYVCICVYLVLLSPLVKPTIFSHGDFLMTLSNPNHFPTTPFLNTTVGLSFHLFTTSQQGLNFNI
jgi:hypothetical protein